MRNVELTTSLPPKRFLAAMAVCLGLIVLGGCSDESDSSAAGSSEADLILGGEPPMSPEAQARADWERADLNRADIAVTGSVSETSDTGATLELSVAVLDKESARGLNLVVYVPDGTEATELSSGDHCSDVQNGKLRCSWQTSLEKGNPFRVEIDLERPERFAGTQARAEVYSASNPPENDSDPYNNSLTLDLS
jgi:hypothetical protein